MVDGHPLKFDCKIDAVGCVNTRHAAVYCSKLHALKRLTRWPSSMSSMVSARMSVNRWIALFEPQDLL